MEVITSLDNKLIKRLAKLKDKKYRDLEDIFLIETEHLIEEAYRCGMLEMVLVLENEDINLDVKKVYVTKNILNKLSSLNSNIKYIGVARKFIPKGYGNRLILLDNLQDPGNLGTIIRSAAAFNIDTIILGNNCVDLYNDKVIRASEGMIFHVDCLRKDLTSLIIELKNNNYMMIGTDVNEGKVLNTFKFPLKFAIIIGNEGNGISLEIKNLVDKNIYIPMNKKTESLNASIAASIIMYEMSKVDYE